MAPEREIPATYLSKLYASVKSQNLPKEPTQWLTQLLYALDQKDVNQYCSFMVPEVTITFNNGDQGKPDLVGIDAARAGLAAFWQSFESIQHEELCLSGTANTIIHEALNHYKTLDGRDVTLRAVAVIERNGDGLITSLRVYSDQSPLYAQ